MVSSTTLFAASPLAADMAIFRKAGFVEPSDVELAQALGLSPTALAARYPSREALVQASLATDLERQKCDHIRLYEQYPSAVERLYSLISYSIQDLLVTDAHYFPDLARFPAAWQVLQDHLAAYSTPQLHQLLNEGIRQGLFRSDINKKAHHMCPEGRCRR